MASHEIISLDAMQVFTNRSHPGIEVTVKLADGTVETAMCTAGNSVGAHEVPFAYDGGTAWKGLGVQRAVDGVLNYIAPAIIGMDASNQYEVDHAMLSLPQEIKAKVGGNAIAATSAAVLKAGAASLGIPLYKHIGGESAMFIPVCGTPAVAGSNRYGGGVTTPDMKPTMSFMCYDYATYSEASYAAWEIKSEWEKIIEAKGGIADFHTFYRLPIGVFNCDEEIWDLMMEAVIASGHEGKVGFQMDCAATCYYDQKNKLYRGLFAKRSWTREELLEYYLTIIKKYPFIILEDPFFEDDYEIHAELTRKTDIQIVGDDLFTTMTDRVQQGAEIGAANAVLLKVNQVGTISQSLEMIQEAYRLGYGVMPCESRGEGPVIADYSVGINACSVREGGTGATANRFLEIEKELGSKAKYQGKHGLMGTRFRG